MKRYWIVCIVMLLVAPAMLTIAWAEKSGMHPKIALLDQDGNPVKDKAQVMATSKTCGQCHDVAYINSHSSHVTPDVKGDCLTCHLKNGQIGDDASELNLQIQLPDNRNCAICHGLVNADASPVSIPDDYARNIAYVAGQKYYGLTQHTGVILSPQFLANSHLNLKDKTRLNFAWDSHSQRQVKCTACHFIANDLRYLHERPTGLDHLRNDPRKSQSPGEILKRPDHVLRTAQCNYCHDPVVTHNRLPYKQRHLDVLACQSCHVPMVYGPAFQTVDRTVVATDGSARILLRGVAEPQRPGNSLNATYLNGYQPSLFPYREANGQLRIAPFNFVTEWRWRSATTGVLVPDAVVKQAYLDGPGTGYAADIMQLFDANQNKALETGELILDHDRKVSLIQAKLKALGIVEPEVAGTVKAYQINHGVVTGKRILRDCNSCHAKQGKFGEAIVLSDLAIAGKLPQFDAHTPTILDGEIYAAANGQVQLQRPTRVTSHYVFGHDRIALFDGLGLMLLFCSILGVAGHGTMRYLASRRHPQHRGATQKVYIYGFYERLWHWIMALSIVALALTGLEVHNTGAIRIFGLEYAVYIHNILAALLVVNAALALFYHLTTGEIMQFFRFNRQFVQETVVQAYYYVYAMFTGASHPINKLAERKFNPLQQLTYVGLLNVLLPFQMATGILIWGAEWPVVSDTLGGLTYLGPIHNLGAWLFFSFLVVHIYLTTTGHTLLSNIQAVITGYDDIPAGQTDPEYQRMMELKVVDLVGTIIGKITAGAKQAATQRPAHAAGVTEDQHEQH